MVNVILPLLSQWNDVRGYKYILEDVNKWRIGERALDPPANSGNRKTRIQQKMYVFNYRDHDDIAHISSLLVNRIFLVCVYVCPQKTVESNVGNYVK